MNSLNVAVLVPCYNEAATIRNVVSDFRRALPEATIYVYDNNSSDDTVNIARAAGAIVRTERHQGKGNVVRRMFSDIEADVYVMVDGDDTYDAGAAPTLIEYLIDETLDMVNGKRVTSEVAAYRMGHRFGNALLTKLVCWFFGEQFKDMLSGYRVFSRRFVKSFPALSNGFEIETELTVHALNLRMPVGEVETNYRSRPEGSISKLNTYRDGVRILKTIMILVKEEMPLQFFSCVGAMLAAISLLLGAPVIEEFLRTGLVPRLPTAVLSVSVMILGFLSLASGLILDTVSHGRREMKRLRYLEISIVTRSGIRAAALGGERRDVSVAGSSGCSPTVGPQAAQRGNPAIFVPTGGAPES